MDWLPTGRILGTLVYEADAPRIYVRVARGMVYIISLTRYTYSSTAGTVHTGAPGESREKV